MGAISGIGGAVDGISTVREWQIQSSADLQAGVASNTKGAPVVLAGNQDWSGSYQAYGHTPLKLPGESFTFTGTIDGAKGAVGTVMVNQVEIAIDIESGAIIAHTVSFESHGELTLGAAVAADASLPTMYSSIGCKVELATPAAGEHSFSELADVRTVTITLSKENPSYVSSSTGGVVKRGEGNLSGTVAITVYADDFSTLPAENDVQAVRVYVDATTYWLFHWIRWGEVTDLTVNREEPNIVPASLSGQFTGFTRIAGTMVEGKIDEPGGTEYWPNDAT